MQPPHDLSDLGVAAGASAFRAVDLAGIALIALFLLLGARRGLWWQVVRLLGVVAAFSTARAVAPRVAGRFAAWLPELDERVAGGLAWVVVLAVALVAVAAVGSLGKRGIDAAMLGGVDRLGGAFAGAMQGACLWLALLFVLLHLAPRGWTRTTLAGSRTERVVASLERSVPELFDARTRAAFGERAR